MVTLFQIISFIKIAFRSPQSEIRIVQAKFLNPETINFTVENIVKSGRVDYLKDKRLAPVECMVEHIVEGIDTGKPVICEPGNGG